jgi:polysaccharide chain length determinant protein (PEP-CTERM system associated)
VLLVAWVVAVPAWLAIASMPSIYESSSRIYVDTSSVLQPLLRGIAVQSNLQSQVELMKQTLLSRPNLEAVARKTDYALTANSDAELEALLNSLQGRTTIASSKQDVFSIAFEDTNPRRAHDVVQALLTIFVESNLGQSRKDLDTAEEFIDGQIADYEARLQEAENRLARFKQEHIDVTFGDGGYLSRATSATNQVKQLEQDLSVATAQRDLLRKELAGIPATLPLALSNAGPPDDTDVRIVELDAQLRMLLSQFTEKHPDVVRTRRQLEALLEKQNANKEMLAAEAAANPEAADESTLGYGEPNPVYEQVKLRIIEMDTQIENLRQRAAGARKDAEALASKAEEVPQIEAEFQRLNRDYNIIKSRHSELLARRESARMSRNRDDIGQQVQYRMIDPPMVANEPAGPNRSLFLYVAAAGAFAVGIGMAVVLMVLDTSFSTLTELRQYTAVPVLGSVSDTSTAKRVTRGITAHFALAACIIAFIAALLLLQVAEKQIGLDKLVAGRFGNAA